MKKFDYYLKLYDLVKGTGTHHYLDFFLQSLKWHKQDLNRYRWHRLKSLLLHAYDYCPYYRESFNRAGIVLNDIRSFKDLEYLPVLTRENIRDHLEGLLCTNKNQYKYFKGSSSGTTGIPVTYYHDSLGFGAGKAAGYLCYYLSGWQLGDRTLHIWGNSASVKQWHSWQSKVKCRLFRQYNLDAAILNDEDNYLRVTDLINKFKPLAIDGYTSSIYHLSRYLQENRTPRYRPQVVFTTAENLFPYQKKTIEQALAPVSDIYGCGEINGIAVRPVHTDKYYIIEPHVVVETEYHRDTRLHEIIVTDLDNRVMPFIRYKPGDFIDRIHMNNDCNNDYETLKFDYFTKIQGRSCDIIQLKNGKKVSAVTIVGGTALREIPGIMKHKVVWDGDCLNFVLETNEHFNLNLAAQKIKKSLNSARYGHDMNFKIETVNQLLPDKSGKFRYFENIGIET